MAGEVSPLSSCLIESNAFLRRCNCIFRDLRNIDRLNLVVRGLLVTTVHNLKYIHRELSEGRAVGGNVGGDVGGDIPDETKPSTKTSQESNESKEEEEEERNDEA